MRLDAAKDGVALNIVSGYRSFDDQLRIRNDKFTNADGLTEQEKVANAAKYHAVPGLSIHHWGTEIDINGDNRDFSLNVPDFIWGKYLQRLVSKKCYPLALKTDNIDCLLAFRGRNALQDGRNIEWNFTNE